MDIRISRINGGNDIKRARILSLSASAGGRWKIIVRVKSYRVHYGCSLRAREIE